MKKSLAERLARAVFVISLSFLAMLYGTVASWWGWFPAPQIGLAHETMVDLAYNWKNDFSLEPTRHLVAPDDKDGPPDPERGFARGPGGDPEPGYTLISGLSDDQDTSFHVVRMFDTEGQEVHRWPIHYERLDAERKPQNVMLHGMEVFEDGSLVLAFDAGNAIARVDACGETMWMTPGGFHHSVARDGAGHLLSWRDEVIVKMDAETGEILSELSLKDQIIPADGGAQAGYLNIRTVEPAPGNRDLIYHADPFHANDVEPLRVDMAEAFAMFEAGDLLISLRELNMVAVIDPESGVLKWWRHGPWIKQHDPDFEADGTITVFDNGTGTMASKVRRIDPADDTLSVDFAGTPEQPFYSWRRGKHQTLPGGNLLLTEAEHGRVLEVDPAGRIVWQRDLVWNDADNLIVTEARHVPEDFFADGLPSCAQEVAAR